MDLGLCGKRALVGGASKRIGKAIAERRAAEGCTLAICARGQALLKQLEIDLMGRLGAPEDVAKALAILASSAASYITGVNLVVDGGFTKRVQF